MAEAVLAHKCIRSSLNAWSCSDSHFIFIETNKKIMLSVKKLFSALFVAQLFTFGAKLSTPYLLTKDFKVCVQEYPSKVRILEPKISEFSSKRYSGGRSIQRFYVSGFGWVLTNKRADLQGM
jgi:hypothetical protein